MKKVLLSFVSLLLPLIASAGTVEHNSVWYTVTSTTPYTAKVTSKTSGYSGSITIPASFTESGITYNVTGIGSHAFADCTGLTSVTIPNSVTEIGSMAFYNCTGLSSINLNQVQTIANNAFSGCTSLTSLNIPATVTSIGYYVFQDCSGLTSITVASENSTYDSRNSCNAIIEKTSNKLIAGCKNTVIPNTVKAIGDCAFRGTGLSSPFSIPNSVTSIGQGAFLNCTGLTSVSIPSGVTQIQLQAFDGCTGLTSVSLNNVTTIDNMAFGDCTGLSSITFPNSLKTLSGNSFGGCTSLTSVTIPSSVQYIYDNPFTGCTSLASITVAAENANFDSRENCNAIIRKAGNVLLSGCKNTTIPNTVESIGNQAFSGCTSLTSINIPKSVTSIGRAAFNTTGLINIVIPSSVTTIGDYAFGGCASFTHVYCNAVSVPTSSNDPFNVSNIANATLHVPSGSLSTYSSATYWKNFKSKVALTSTSYGCLTKTQTGPSTYDIAIDGNSTTDLTLTTSVTGNVTITRDFTAGKKATICLPFSVTASQRAALGKFYQFSGLKAGTTDVVQMTEITSGGLTANTPYIFEPSATATSIDFGSKTIAANPAPVDPGTGSYAFQGTYSYKDSWTSEEISGGVYGFALSGYEGEGFSQGDFVRLGSGATVRPFRCYLKNAGNLSDAATARKRAGVTLPDVIRIEWISADGSVTSISGVTKVETLNEGWFSLDGRKLSDKPATKGVYINNGRKVVIK